MNAFGSLAALIPLVAQNAPGGGMLQMVTLFLPLIFLFYFLLYRPQKRQQENRTRMLSEIKKNDKVVTIGGLYGTVVTVRREADRVTLRVGDDTRLDFELSAISRIIDDESSDKSSASSPAK